MGWFSSEAKSAASRNRASSLKAVAAKAVAAKAGAAKADGDAPELDRLATRQRRDLAAIRRLAMRFVSVMDRCAQGKGEETDKELLKKNGVIDGFNTLAQVVTRVIDKERQSYGVADASPENFSPNEQSGDKALAAGVQPANPMMSAVNALTKRR